MALYAVVSFLKMPLLMVIPLKHLSLPLSLNLSLDLSLPVKVVIEILNELKCHFLSNRCQRYS
jgi:hypothetical protein